MMSIGITYRSCQQRAWSVLIIMISPLLASAQINYARDLVNPLIGTGGHGHTFPGACVPFGLVQLSPDTRPDGTHDWDGASGYHYSDSIIYGFSHTHLSGTGVSDLCDVLLMPISGETGVAFNRNTYASRFDHDSEDAYAGSYSVTLFGAAPRGGTETKEKRSLVDPSGPIHVELTSTARVGVHRYSYPKKADARLVLDLRHRDKLIGSTGMPIQELNDREIVGERRSSSWAKDQRLFYCIRFSEPVVARDIMPSNIHGFVAGYNFGQLDVPLIVKVGISAVSIEGARSNLDAEVPHWDFDQVRAEAEAEWNKALGKIKVEGGTREEKRIFYSALYHTMIAPYIFNDVDGHYRGMDGEIHHADHNVYTVFSLWDTFRALHPLMTILEPERTNDFIRTMLLHYQQSGRLPVWELWGNETDCMIGYHSVSVIADAYFKGIRDYDVERALEAIVASADQDHFGLDSYKEHGYIRSEDEAESVSRTLEYAYDDWCIARMAEDMGQAEIAERFHARSRNWQNVFDPETGFFRARRNGGFVEPFDPHEVNFHFTEANAWHYSLFVPHDLDQLIALLGGKDALTQRLDELFTADDKTTGRDQSDITGLIGQYAHGNEPSHNYAWLYNLSSRPFSSEVYVHKIMKELYADKPDGLPGNEDCGQMSAWYVLSAMGHYPITPGDPTYTLGIPLFDSIAVDLGGGRALNILTESGGGSRAHIESVTWNGMELDDFRMLTHSELINGGTLHYVLGPRPGSSPPTIDRDENVRVDSTNWRPVPIITARSASFTDTLTISILSSDPSAELEYSVDDGPRIPYREPFIIHATSTIHAYDGDRSISGKFTKIEDELSITLESEPAPQYMASGQNALIDGLRGSSDFRTGDWQGFEAQDVIATIDLGRPRKIERIGLGMLQDPRSWIWFPEQVQFAFSTNQRQWSSEFATHDVGRDEEGVIVRDLMTGPIQKRARYIKVIATSAGPCPEWHPGAGKPGWIFADEVLIHFEGQ